MTALLIPTVPGRQRLREGKLEVVGLLGERVDELQRFLY